MTDAGDRYIRESLCTRMPHSEVAQEAFFVTGRLASARCAADSINTRLGLPQAGLEVPLRGSSVLRRCEQHETSTIKRNDR